MQTGIAQAEAMIGSAKSYLYDQTARVWQLLLSGQRPTPVDTGRHSIAYINAYRTCREAVDQLYCLAGASVIQSAGSFAARYAHHGAACSGGANELRTRRPDAARG